MERDDVGRLIARLAVAIIAADGRITTPELAALERLDGFGLGPLADVAREEIQRAVHEPVDVGATCAALPPLGEETAALLLTVLAELAAIDRVISPRERDVFNIVADHLGVEPSAAERILDAAITIPAMRAAGVGPPAAPPQPNDARAFRMLGLDPGASRSRIDATYLELLHSYDPARVAELGPEFAALAVRRLAGITDAYEAALASLEPSAS